MGVRLSCVRCGQPGLSALVYRGPGQHGCRRCGATLVLADGEDERRSGRDRRRNGGMWGWPDWRSGYERREARGSP